jgi:hypothetical protein
VGARIPVLPKNRRASLRRESQFSEANPTFAGREFRLKLLRYILDKSPGCRRHDEHLLERLELADDFRLGAWIHVSCQPHVTRKKEPFALGGRHAFTRRNVRGWRSRQADCTSDSDYGSTMAPSRSLRSGCIFHRSIGRECDPVRRPPICDILHKQWKSLSRFTSVRLHHREIRVATPARHAPHHGPTEILDHRGCRKSGPRRRSGTHAGPALQGLRRDHQLQ